MLAGFLLVAGQQSPTYNQGFVDRLVNNYCTEPSLSQHLYCQSSHDQCGVILRQTVPKSLNPFSGTKFNNLLKGGFSAYGCFYIDNFTSWDPMCILVPTPDDCILKLYEPMGVNTFPREALSGKSATCQSRALFAELYLAGELDYGTTDLESYAQLSQDELAAMRCTESDEKTSGGMTAIYRMGDNNLQCSDNGCMGYAYVFDPPYPPTPPPAPTPPPLPPGWLCNNDCNYANDGECDDGGAGSEYAECGQEGHDCADCGARDPEADSEADESRLRG